MENGEYKMKYDGLRLPHGRRNGDSPRGHFLGLLGGFFDSADVHECRFGKLVPLAVADFLEALDRLGQRSDLARLPGKDFGHEKRLRQKALDAPGAMHDEFVVFAELIDAENGDDVLQLAIALQGLLDAAGDLVMPIADILRVENSARRSQGVDGRVNSFFRNLA